MACGGEGRNVTIEEKNISRAQVTEIYKNKAKIKTKVNIVISKSEIKNGKKRKYMNTK